MELDDKIHDLREDFNGELNEINTRLDNQRRVNANTRNDDDRHLRVVVRNLPEAVNENVMQKVDSVIKDGLKINDIHVVSAERKDSRNDSRPGLVIAKFSTSEEKKTVMAAKKNLRDNRQYSTVYINHDLSREGRNLASNMRTLLSGVRRGQNLQVRGTRIVTTEGTGDRYERRGGVREGRADAEPSTEGYRARYGDRGTSNQRQNEDRSRVNARSEQRYEGNTRDNGQRETTRQNLRGDNGRGRSDNRRGQNQWNHRRH